MMQRDAHGHLIGFCLNCDNRHGCRTGTPYCLTALRNPDELDLRGKDLLRQRGLLRVCGRCKLFRQCWQRSQYERALRANDGTREE